MAKGHNVQYQLVLSDVQSLKRGGGHYARATVSRSEHSPACVFITGRSGRPAADLCREAPDRGNPSAPARRRSVHVVPVDAKGNRRHGAHARHTDVVCVTQSGAQRGRRGRSNCRTLHTGADATFFAVDDGHSQYLSGIPVVGAICGAACSGRVALLAAATACALGTDRKFLRRALAEGGTWHGLTPLPFGRT